MSTVKEFLQEVCETYEESVLSGNHLHVVLDTTKIGPKSETVKSVTNALGLPTVTSSFGQVGDLRQWKDLNKMQEQYLLHIMTPEDLIPMVIRSISIGFRFSNAAVLYDDSFIMEHKYKTLFQNLPTKHIITKMISSSLEERNFQIVKLRQLNINNFFLLGTIESIKSTLECLEELYFSRHFAWYAITSENKAFNSLRKKKNLKMLFMQPRIESNKLQHLKMLQEHYGLNGNTLIDSVFYFDLAVRTFLATRDYLKHEVWENSTVEYMLCDEFNGNNNFVRNINLRKYFTEVTEPTTLGSFALITDMDETFNGASYMKFEMDLFFLNITQGEVIYKEVIGNWSTGLSSPVYAYESKVANVTAEVTHRIYTVAKPPFIIRDPTAPKGYKGFCIDLINEIARMVEFDYIIYEADDGKFGTMDDNGTWDGVVRKLIDKEADIGLGSLSVMSERENVIDFTVPFYDLVGMTIMMLKPSQQKSIFKFLNVLKRDVWFCILGAFCFTSFLIWIFDKCSPYSYQNNREKFRNDDERREFDLKECLWFCITSLTPQGGGEAPKNLSGRLVAATWWLFGFIIMSSYTANLAAFLTVSRLDSPINSLDDLLNQYKLSYAPLNNSVAMLYFKRMAEVEQYFYKIWKDMTLNDSLTPLERSNIAVWDYPVSSKYSKIWKAIQETGMPNTVDEAIARVRNSTPASGFAYLDEATDIRYLVTTNCDLQMVGEEFSRKPYAIAVQQGSHLKDQFNSAILNLLNKRALEKLKMKWWSSNGVKCEDYGDSSDGITVHNIGGVFILIFIGIGFAFLTLVFEFLYLKNRKPQFSTQRTDNYSAYQRPQQFIGSHPNKSIKGKEGNDNFIRSRIKHPNKLPKPRF